MVHLDKKCMSQACQKKIEALAPPSPRKIGGLDPRLRHLCQRLVCGKSWS